MGAGAVSRLAFWTAAARRAEVPKRQVEQSDGDQRDAQADPFVPSG
jgi:hypothetical protein